MNQRRKDELERTVRSIAHGLVVEVSGRPAEQVRVGLSDSLERDLGLDSLARVELLLRIHRELEVDLPERTLEEAETLGDLVEAVRAARGAPAASGPPVESQLAESLGPEQADPDAPPDWPRQARTLLEVLAWHCERHPERRQLVVLGDEGEQAIDYGTLARTGRRVAAALRQRGVQPGQTVALMLPTSAEYFFTYVGILLAGAVPVPVYPPARLAQLEEHVRRHTGILANARAVMLVTVPQARSVADALQGRVESLREVVSPQALLESAEEAEPVERSAEDVALIQYTSGSTGDPKGVVLTHANLLANIRSMGRALDLRNGDVFVSWLPLYHDMGLIGAWLGTLHFGLPLVVMSPLAFLAQPARWLRAIHRYRGTLSAGPNFSYELCTRKIDAAELEGLDLSCWRIAFNGAEPVMPESLDRFVERFGAYGLRRETLLPVYGLAECCVGLAFPRLGRAPRIDRVDRDALVESGEARPAAQGAEHPVHFVSLGRAIPEHEIRVVDDQGMPLDERLEGSVEFRGPSTTRGYRDNDAANAKLFHDGWLASGDRGYLADGELFLTGRAKDIVIRGGRNIYPQEVEEAVGGLEGVRKGCVAVFGSADSDTGTERLVVMAETRLEAPQARERLQAVIGERVLDTLGEPADRILLVAPHTVLKTSSGKIRRSACRELYESGRLGARRPSARRQALAIVVQGFLQRMRRRLADWPGLLWGMRVWLAFVLLVPFVWLACVLARDPVRGWAIAHRGARLLFRLAGLRPQVRGLETLPADARCVLVANHASYADGLVVAATLARPCAFVAKRELASHPIAGPFLRAIGARFVERFEARQSVEDARRLESTVGGAQVPFYFAEGTFHRDAGLRHFHLGAFAAAAQAGVPVVPVALRGTRRLLPADSKWPQRSAVSVTVGEPIAPPQDARDVFAAAITLRDRAREHIAAHCGEPDLAAGSGGTRGSERGPRARDDQSSRAANFG